MPLHFKGLNSSFMCDKSSMNSTILLITCIINTKPVQFHNNYSVSMSVLKVHKRRNARKQNALNVSFMYTM